MKSIKTCFSVFHSWLHRSFAEHQQCLYQCLCKGAFITPVVAGQGRFSAMFDAKHRRNYGPTKRRGLQLLHQFLGCVLRYFLMFIPIWGRFPLWQAFFSIGLKPPPSDESTKTIGTNTKHLQIRRSTWQKPTTTWPAKRSSLNKKDPWHLLLEDCRAVAPVFEIFEHSINMPNLDTFEVRFPTRIGPFSRFEPWACEKYGWNFTPKYVWHLTCFFTCWRIYIYIYVHNHLEIKEK